MASYQSKPEWKEQTPDRHTLQVEQLGRDSERYVHCEALRSKYGWVPICEGGCVSPLHLVVTVTGNVCAELGDAMTAALAPVDAVRRAIDAARVSEGVE